MKYLESEGLEYPNDPVHGHCRNILLDHKSAAIKLGMTFRIGRLV
jgi:hypothetical protein